MPTTEAAWYDRRLVEGGDAQLRPFWALNLDLYERAAELIPPDRTVVELGCGTGRFARYLVESGRAEHYVCGLDFSTAAIEEAKRYVPELAHNFEVRDLRTDKIPSAGLRQGCYVALELLEHLYDDRGLVRELVGSYLVASVPSFESEAHLRVFRSSHDVLVRYRDLIVFDHMERLPVAYGECFWLFAGDVR